MSIKSIDMTKKVTMKILAEKLNEIVEAQNSAPVRNRGPKSEHSMTLEDAKSIISGELKDLGHKDAAEKLGLSYGQVYSARKGFTFKEVHAEIRKAAKAVSK